MLEGVHVALMRCLDRLTGKPAARRSPLWPACRAGHLRRQPRCAACATTQHLAVHHIQPFHIRPELELADGLGAQECNLVTLCESPAHNCHLIWGHCLSWSSWNPEVVADAATFLRKVEARPQWVAGGE